MKYPVKPVGVFFGRPSVQSQRRVILRIRTTGPRFNMSAFERGGAAEEMLLSEGYFILEKMCRMRSNEIPSGARFERSATKGANMLEYSMSAPVAGDKFSVIGKRSCAWKGK